MKKTSTILAYFLFAASAFVLMNLAISLGMALYLSVAPSPAEAAGGLSIVVATPEVNGIAAAGVTGTTGGSANTVLTLTKDRHALEISYSLNQETMLTLGGSNFMLLPAVSAGTIVPVNFTANSTVLPSGTVIGVYATGTGPTGGKVYVTGF